MTPTKTLKIAERVAADRCTITDHVGAHGHRAVQLTGCFADDARDIAREIADALEKEATTQVMRERGYPAVRADAGFVVIWYH